MSDQLVQTRTMLEALGVGDLDRADARRAVRAAMAAGGTLVSEAYNALRGAAWVMIRAREVPDDIAQWHDLYTHAAALARHHDRPDLSERLAAVAEMVGQTARFADRQPIREVLGRAHVSGLLSVLARTADGRLPRADLAKASKLADSNLSRVLAIMRAHGLVTRARRGKEAEIVLTAEGAAAAARLGSTSAERSRTPAEPWWEALDLPIAIWSPEGEPIGRNRAFDELMRQIELPAASVLTRAEWQRKLEEVTIVHAETGGEEDIQILQLRGNRWVQLHEASLREGGVRTVLVDVTDVRDGAILAMKRHADAIAEHELSRGALPVESPVPVLLRA